jgi:hypothetical protein
LYEYFLFYGNVLAAHFTDKSTLVLTSCNETPKQESTEITKTETIKNDKLMDVWIDRMNPKQKNYVDISFLPEKA